MCHVFGVVLCAVFLCHVLWFGFVIFYCVFSLCCVFSCFLWFVLCSVLCSVLCLVMSEERTTTALTARGNPALLDFDPCGMPRPSCVQL